LKRFQTRFVEQNQTNLMNQKESQMTVNIDPLFEQKLELATEGLEPHFLEHLKTKISPDNALTISKYILSMRVETSLSTNYRRTIISSLKLLSEFLSNRPFSDMTRDDIISFLDSLRKDDSEDPMHKWIGSYNLRLISFMRFFKWLYYQNIEPSKRPKSHVIENIPLLKRKEQSIYKPSDLWTSEDDLLFLKYCPSKRIKCFHAISRDTSCRPHELLKLRIKDIMFKNEPTGNRQYAEILVSGKTGSRHIPLIDALPYIKDYIDHEHPSPSNQNAILLCGFKKSLGKPIGVITLYQIYDRYKKEIFPKLLQDPNVSEKDKQKLAVLLKKPWNQYIRRHSALTEKSSFLKEHILRQHAGWSPRSQMHLKYLHYFGNESSESILEAYGIITKEKQQRDVLKPKQCPNCGDESTNKPDAKFCAKCRMVLTYDAYSETAEEYTRKENELQSVKERMKNIEKLLIAVQPILQNIKPEMLGKLQMVVKE
jgi:integrase/recombinase XerD